MMECRRNVGPQYRRNVQRLKKTGEVLFHLVSLARGAGTDEHSH
jgi:hypothetical protein